MTVRLRIALTIFLAGLVAALGVVITVVVAFQRFEHESRYDRGNAFLGRVVAQHEDILDLHARNPAEFGLWLKSLLLFEPETQLYLLGADGSVLASTGQTPLAAGFKVALAPVMQAVAAAQGNRRAPYVMGDDPEHMQTDAVIVARALQRAVIRPSDAAAGYLYLVAQRGGAPGAGGASSGGTDGGRLALFRSSLAGPALLSVLAVIIVTTGLAVWIVGTVTRPLRSLSEAVAAAARDGFTEAAEAPVAAAVDPALGGARPHTTRGVPPSAKRRDELGQLRDGFQALLATLRAQWSSLRQLDHFRREGVSNLSHDLRSPLTATVACLETLERRWAAPRTAAPGPGGDAAERGGESDRQLVEVALRNARNAAQLVRSLGDLALLDEPQFKLAPMLMDVGEVLDDIALRFADRAQGQGVALVCELPSSTGAPMAFARIDVELFERAVANLLDNALKFTSAPGHITLAAQTEGGQLRVSVADTGIGIALGEQGPLFDRLFQGTGARSQGGKGLGLAIVKRIAELHGGAVALHSQPGQGTTVTLTLPAA